jgi:hypothetical protein
MSEKNKYRLLNTEEQEILERKLKLFNSLSYVLKKDIAQYNCEIRHTQWKLKHLDTEECKDVTPTQLNIMIKGYEKISRASEQVIKETRPHTPQGKKVCHLCDIIGMALVEKHTDKGYDKLKCQNPKCGAVYKDTTRYIHV